MQYLQNKKLLAKVFSAVILFAILTILLFNWIMSAALHSRKEVIVPDIKKKSIYEALKLASSMDLGLRIEGEELNQDLPAGTVVRQTPYPGISVKVGKVIRVTVSQGGDVIFTPNLIGQPVRSARITLRSSGLSLGEESSRYSAVYEKEQVISQDPGAGKVVERDSLVNLVVSAGVPPGNVKLVPNFVGKNSGDAKAWADGNKVELNISEENNRSYSLGTVISQKPDPDTELQGGQKLELTVAGSSSAEISGGKKFVYDIPVGGEDRNIKLNLIDETGEKEIFSGSRPSGSKLEVNINPKGQARVRVFVNNVMVEEREID
jgi:serine/threonine-protein kinase